MNIKTVNRQVKDISCLIVAYDVSKNKHVQIHCAGSYK